MDIAATLLGLLVAMHYLTYELSSGLLLLSLGQVLKLCTVSLCDKLLLATVVLRLI